MKTTNELTMYAYAQLCGVSGQAIANRVKKGHLVLNDNNKVPAGTLIVKKLKWGRPKQVIKP